MVIEHSKATGEAGVRGVLSHGVDLLNQHKFSVATLSLGGTIGMTLNHNGQLTSGAPGALGTEELVKFNNRSILVLPQRRLESVEKVPILYSRSLQLATGSGFPPLADSDDSINETRERAIHESGLWPDTVMGFGLAQGFHPLVELTQSVRTNPLYAALLAEVIYKMPNGVRLDSNHAFDRSCVWPAVVCGYLVPEIFTAAAKFVKENGDSIDEALKELVFIVPIGTDRQREVAAFLDVLAFYSGTTFVTVGANSSFGTLGGDAEQNLSDSLEAVSLMKQGKLPRGFAYSIADGLIMQGILKKMDPSAKGLKQTVVVPGDTHRYGGTFLANTAVPMEIVKTDGYPLITNSSQTQSILDLLGTNKPEDQKEQAAGHEGVKLNAADLAQAINCVQILSPLDLPETLKEGTQMIILEGGGKGNVTAQTTRLLELLAGQQWARSRRTMKPTVVITSEAGIPYVDEDYAASPIGKLDLSPLIRGVINARGLPAHIVAQLATLFHYPGVVNTNAGISFHRADEYIDPIEFERLLIDYGTSRKFPGFLSNE